MQRFNHARGRLLAALAAVLALACGAGTAEAQTGPGFKTSQAPMLVPIVPEVTVEPIITVGERLPNGYLFESIPDGIAVDRITRNEAEIYVNHELSLVPFPGIISDFTNSILSRLVLSRETAGVLDGSYVIPSTANYQRFCSNFLATTEHGFERPLLLTNEEASDFVNRTGISWPARPGAEQAGVVVAYDPRSGAYRSIYGMGRMNHENSMAVPGYGHPVVLTGDDTFTAPSSQLYLYTAASAEALWNDEGELWGFRSDDPLINDYGDLSGDASVSGEFIPVPRSVALGDQTALENWSNANNVFQFIRVEDTAYDRNDPNVVYIADTGEPRALPGSPTGRLTRGPAGPIGPYPNGRIFRLELDPADPTRVLDFSILIDGDALGAFGAGLLSLIHNPDNLETTERTLLIQEDPGSHNQYAPGDSGGTTARIWSYDFATRALVPVARVDQSGDPAARLGAWESSGIVDASAAFGPGAFLVDVQAGTLVIDRAPGPGVVYEREGGQLLLLRIPPGTAGDDDGGGDEDDADED